MEKHLYDHSYIGCALRELPYVYPFILYELTTFETKIDCYYLLCYLSSLTTASEPTSMIIHVSDFFINEYNILLGL